VAGHERPHTGLKARLADRERFLAWVFLLPPIVYLVALVAVPFCLTVAYAFSGTKDRTSRFSGLHNIRAIVTDEVVWRSAAHTLILTSASVVLVMIFGKLLAGILRMDFRGKWPIRFLVLMPWTTPVALSAISWRWLLDPVYSPAGRFLRDSGLAHGDASWLARPQPALATVVAVHVWRLTPLAAMIMSAGLASVPREVDEAARLDGAGFWRRTFEVTIPLTFPVDAVAAVFAAVITFSDVAVVRVLTGGGPHDSTQVLPALAYLRGVDDGDAGQGAAIGLFLFPLLLAAVIALLRAVRRLETG
jgi:multiple sugar transport system permease protein